jgi:hypothetical protein
LPHDRRHLGEDIGGRYAAVFLEEVEHWIFAIPRSRHDYRPTVLVRDELLCVADVIVNQNISAAAALTTASCEDDVVNNEPVAREPFSCRRFGGSRTRRNNLDKPDFAKRVQHIRGSVMHRQRQDELAVFHDLDEYVADMTTVSNLVNVTSYLGWLNNDPEMVLGVLRNDGHMVPKDSVYIDSNYNRPPSLWQPHGNHA